MKAILPAVLVTILFAATAVAQDREEIARECAPLTDCLDKIGQTLPKQHASRIFSDEEKVARILKSRFGRAARDALLQKALGSHGGWRNYAEGVLQYWQDWSEEDVPVLKRALRNNPGGRLAYVLAGIGSPAAIQALLEDLVGATGRSATVLALLGLGPKVLNGVLPALEGSDAEVDEPFRAPWQGAVVLIEEFGSRATVIADDWIGIAKDRREPQSKRIAALRGLAAMNGYLGAKSAALRSLMRDPDEAVAKQAFETLVDTYDPSVARKAAALCKPNAAKWDEIAWKSFDCLKRLSEFGTNAQAAGDLLTPFLKSENKAEQLFAIEALGLIGDRRAVPEIELFLNSPDWRHVYTAVRALAQLRSLESLPKIEAAARHFWLWEVRDFSKRAVRLLVRNQPYSEVLGGNWSLHEPGGFGAYRDAFKFADECETGVWSYRNERLTFEKSSYEDHPTVTLPDGELVRTDRGEFGGSLVWRPNSGEEVTLVDDNTSYIFQAGDHFISIHGLAHRLSSYGFAALITRDKDNQFTAKEIARFTGKANPVKRLGDDLFAANSHGRVVIFSTEGIQEEAWCDRYAEARQKAAE